MRFGQKRRVTVTANSRGRPGWAFDEAGAGAAQIERGQVIIFSKRLVTSSEACQLLLSSRQVRRALAMVKLGRSKPPATRPPEVWLWWVMSKRGVNDPTEVGISY